MPHHVDIFFDGYQADMVPNYHRLCDDWLAHAASAITPGVLYRTPSNRVAVDIPVELRLVDGTANVMRDQSLVLRNGGRIDLASALADAALLRNPDDVIRGTMATFLSPQVLETFDAHYHVMHGDVASPFRRVLIPIFSDTAGWCYAWAYTMTTRPTREYARITLGGRDR